MTIGGWPADTPTRGSHPPMVDDEETQVEATGRDPGRGPPEPTSVVSKQPAPESHTYPVNRPWREGVVTRGKELEELNRWNGRHPERVGSEELSQAVCSHVRVAIERARDRNPWRAITGSSLQGATTNLDAAEACLLRLAPETTEGVMVVCPTAQSVVGSADTSAAIDPVMDATAGPWDLFTVEALGLAAAAISGAVALRNIHRTRTPVGIPSRLRSSSCHSDRSPPSWVFC